MKADFSTYLIKYDKQFDLSILIDGANQISPYTLDTGQIAKIGGCQMWPVNSWSRHFLLSSLTTCCWNKNGGCSRSSRDLSEMINLPKLMTINNMWQIEKLGVMCVYFADNLNK